MQTMQAALRTQANDPESLTRSVREALRGVDADLPIANVTTLAALVDDSTAQTRFSLFLVGSFAGLALILATIGLYGVVSYSVQQRTHEIGIRISVGATRRDVLKMVLGSGARLAGVGIIAGLLAAWAVTRMLSSFLYGVRPTDPLTFTAVAALLLGVALLACYLPGAPRCRDRPAGRAQVRVARRPGSAAIGSKFPLESHRRYARGCDATRFEFVHIVEAVVSGVSRRPGGAGTPIAA
jgi:predicted lysophospholipase L1 biosynthesis ABC-type transport system permease subunit